MDISLAGGGLNGFRRWSIAHRPSSNDDNSPGGATPIALVKPLSAGDEREDLRHRPWVIPGVGGSF
jgi:hypothetical protein